MNGCVLVIRLQPNNYYCGRRNSEIIRICQNQNKKCVMSTIWLWLICAQFECKQNMIWDEMQTSSHAPQKRLAESWSLNILKFWHPLVRRRIFPSTKWIELFFEIFVSFSSHHESIVRLATMCKMIHSTPKILWNHTGHGVGDIGIPFVQKAQFIVASNKNQQHTSTRISHTTVDYILLFSVGRN